MQSHPEGWEVGQSVWVVHRMNVKHGGSSATIAKIGRVWITLDDGRTRFDPETGDIDGKGYYPWGKVYVTQHEYAASQAASVAWDGLKTVIRNAYYRPPHLTLADIEAMTAKISPPKQETT
jgi:hypothetical protein